MSLELKSLKKFQGRKGPLLLIIMDGVGIGKNDESNAVYLANAPVLKRLLKTNFYTQLKAHGKAVGLPSDGDMGNSEVGHNAIGAGRVVMVADRYYAGRTVVIDHGLRLFSLYIHLSEELVREGQSVRKGQLIGRVGRTGRVTGPHLHLGTKVEGVTFDPVSLLDFDFEGPEPPGPEPGKPAK